MSHFLPPAILAMFAPRPPLPFKPPVEKNGLIPYSGIAEYTKYMRPASELAPLEKNPTPAEIKAARKAEKMLQNQKLVEEQKAAWNPKENANATEDPYKTLFVGRLSYDVKESDLRKEFEYYGPVKSIKLVQDKKGKPRGYAFVEFVHERDLKEAYKGADGRRISGRRVVVDVERGRTVKNWFPRRLGGGLGGTRIGKKEQNDTSSGRYNPKPAGAEDRASDRDRDRDRGDRDRERVPFTPSSRRRSRSRSPRRSDRDRGDRGADRERERDYRPRDHDRDRHHSDRDRDRDRGRGYDRDRGR